MLLDNYSLTTIISKRCLVTQTVEWRLWRRCWRNRKLLLPETKQEFEFLLPAVSAVCVENTRDALIKVSHLESMNATLKH